MRSIVGNLFNWANAPRLIGKFTGVVPKVWVVTGNVNTTSQVAGNGFGIQSAGLIAGGYTTTNIARTEEYDGSIWTNSNNLSTARRQAATGGIQSDAFIVGGYGGSRLTSTEEYNGSSWSAGGTISVGTDDTRGCGTSTNAGLMAGGTTGTGRTTNANIYNGATWSATGALNVGVVVHFMVGTTGAAISFGGHIGPYTNKTEIFNGTTWSVGNNLPASIVNHNGAGNAGDAICFGGHDGVNTRNETYAYNGTIWSTLAATLNLARNTHGGGGTSQLAYAVTGDVVVGRTATTENYG